MTTLAEFVMARLADQRGVIARWDSDASARVASMWTGGHPGYSTVASDHADNRWIADGAEVEDPRHVLVLWDPARELLDLQAKEQIVHLHVPNRTSYPPRFDEFDPHSVEVCGGCGDERYPERPGCTTLRLLAVQWRDHPEYEETWKP